MEQYMVQHTVQQSTAYGTAYSTAYGTAYGTNTRQMEDILLLNQPSSVFLVTCVELHTTARVINIIIE